MIQTSNASPPIEHTYSTFSESIEMLRITPEITPECAEGDGAPPINSSSGHPFCSLCHELLSDDYKENYIQQSSFQRRTFPCECKDKGCQSEEYPDNLHFEKTCHCRLVEKPEHDFEGEENTTKDCDDKEKGFFEKVRISCRGIDVEIDFQSSDSVYENEIGNLRLNYYFKIKAQDDYQFNVKNLKSNEDTTYKKIVGEGSLFLELTRNSHKYKYHCQNIHEDILNTTRDTSIRQTNNDNFFLGNDDDVISDSSSKEELTSECSEIRSIKEDSCETIEISSQHEVNSVNTEVRSSEDLNCENKERQETSDFFHSSTLLFSKFCSNCSRVIEEESIYHCLFGHDSCKKCKGKPCLLCQKMMGEAKTYCKNYHKGCRILSDQEHATRHEIDCEFNNFRCPYPRCIFLNSLSDLKVHFLNSHNKSLIQSNSILEVLNGRKDRKWYIYCYDSLFVCSYYYYGTHIEFILKYIGANDRAKFYQLEVEIKTMKEGKFSKKAMCAGWNDLSLCKGIYFDYEDLTNSDNSRFQFTASLKIVNVNNGLNVSS